MYILSMFYHPAFHAFATTVLLVHNPYPVMTHAYSNAFYKLDSESRDWFFNLYPLPSWSTLTFVSLLSIVSSLRLCFDELTLQTPSSHSCLGGVWGHLPSASRLVPAVCPQSPFRTDPSSGLFLRWHLKVPPVARKRQAKVFILLSCFSIQQYIFFLPRIAQGNSIIKPSNDMR